MRRYDLTFRDADAESRVGLNGAEFYLISEGGKTLKASSNDAGIVTFYPLLPGHYTLTEVMPPPGYQLHPVSYPVSVHSCGCCCINGRPSRSFVLLERRLPTTLHLL